MGIPVMFYVGLVDNLIFVILSIWGYFYIYRKTGKKWNFIPIFAAAWLASAISYILLISGVSADIWYITFIRIVSYVLFLATIIVMIIELARPKRVEVK